MSVAQRLKEKERQRRQSKMVQIRVPSGLHHRITEWRSEAGVSWQELVVELLRNFAAEMKMPEEKKMTRYGFYLTDARGQDFLLHSEDIENDVLAAAFAQKVREGQAGPLIGLTGDEAWIEARDADRVVWRSK